MSIFNRVKDALSWHEGEQDIKNLIENSRYKEMASIEDVKSYVNTILKAEEHRLLSKYNFGSYGATTTIIFDRLNGLRDLQSAISKKDTYDEIVDELKNSKSKVSTSVFSWSGIVGRCFSSFGLFKSTGSDNIDLLIKDLHRKRTWTLACIKVNAPFFRFDDKNPGVVPHFPAPLKDGDNIYRKKGKKAL